MDNNENMENLADTQVEDLCKKRKDTKKFLKIYMFTLFSVVIILIGMSYYGQNKLTQEIQYLTTVLDSKQQEAISHMNKVEKLQILTDEQEKLIRTYEATISETEIQTENKDKIIKGYDDFMKLQSLYIEQKFEECAVILLEVLSNDTIINANMIAETEKISLDLIEKQLITQEQIDQVKKIKNEG